MSDGSFTSKFTERSGTPSASCTPQGPWIHSVTYISEGNGERFYVAFEDGNPTGSSFNNDGDYNDYVFFFTGLTCQAVASSATFRPARSLPQRRHRVSGHGGTTCKPLVQPGQNTEKVRWRRQ